MHYVLERYKGLKTPLPKLGTNPFQVAFFFTWHWLFGWEMDELLDLQQYDFERGQHFLQRQLAPVYKYIVISDNLQNVCFNFNNTTWDKGTLSAPCNRADPLESRACNLSCIDMEGYIDKLELAV